MNKECDIVNDLLPLYIEDITNEGTNEFVNNHIKTCKICQKKLESLKNESKEVILKDRSVVPLKKVKNKILIRIVLIALIVCIISLVGSYSYFRNKIPSHIQRYFTKEEIKLLYHHTTKEEEGIANTVISNAKIVFDDCSHTDEENQNLYGILSKYATVKNSFPNISYVKSDIKLLSASITNNCGYIWIKYTKEVYNNNDNAISGSWNVEALWKIEKNSQNNWQVVDIKEHP